MKGLKKIWENRNQILEGIKNNVFKNDDVEAIAAEREAICTACPHIDNTGSSCLVPGTQPCCGKCGCSLKLKLRSLSSACGDEENPRWDSFLTWEEEEELKDQINNKETNPNQNGDSIQSPES